jgi:hypothetical protein
MYHRVLAVAMSISISILTCFCFTPSSAAEGAEGDGPSPVGAVAIKEAAEGSPYEFRIRAEGGLAPLKWRVASGELPAGIELQADGTLKGVPTSARRDPYVFTVEVSDSSEPPQTSDQVMEVIVRSAPLKIVLGDTRLRITTGQPAGATASDAGGEKAASAAAKLAAIETPATKPPAGGDKGSNESLANNPAGEGKDTGAAGQPGSRAAGTQSSGPQTYCVKGKLQIKDPVNGNALSEPATGVEVAIRPTSDGARVGTTVTKKDEGGVFHTQVLIYPSTSSGDTSDGSASKPVQYKIVFSGQGLKTRVRDDLQFAGIATGNAGSGPCPGTGQTDNALDLGDIYLEPITSGTGELARAIIGFEQSGAASSDSIQNYFMDFFISVPFPYLSKERTGDLSKDGISQDLGSRVRMWGDVHIGGAPQNETGSLTDFVGGFVSGFGSQPVKDVAKAFEFLVGPDVRLLSPKRLFPGFDGGTKQRFSMSLIADGGTITSLQLPSSETENTIFELPQQKGQQQLLRDIAGHPVTKDFLAFIPEDQNRFMHEFYGGLRFKTYYYDRYGNPLGRFPATLDLTYGGNEAATGGHLRGGVFRVDAFYPLPYERANFIYLFGTALLKPEVATSQATLELDAVSTQNGMNINPMMATTTCPKDLTLATKCVALIPVGQIDRDYYRVGIGIDAIAFFKFLKNPTGTQKSAGSN